MLRVIQSSSAAGAKSYYSTADYYTEGQELDGVWRGEGAKRLGLTGIVQREDWDALCDNRNPETGKLLTQRYNANRRVGYDFNFHVPKSVSVLYGLTKDDRILDAFRDSVNATMLDIEAEMKTRVRTGGRDEDRATGNMIWGEYVHTTARPVDGIPDPHLHAHCFVFNTTFDKIEGRWKAGQFADLKRDAPYFEAVFHSRFARRMAELGLGVERNKKSWELAGISKETIDRFSRRTALIEAAAKERGITDESEKSELGAKTRESKRKDLSFDELRNLWESQLSSEERAAVREVESRIGDQSIPENERVAEDAVDYALNHGFERNSVLPERTLLTHAIKRSVGAASPETVKRKLQSEDLIIAVRDGRRMATTREVLAEERRMIEFAREGRGTCQRLGDAYTIKRDWLNDGQRRAVHHVLNSSDRVMLIRGGAGTGKTTMMQEAVEAIQAHGKRVFTFAPSASASRDVLRADGFANADTVARLLLDERLQNEIHGQVIWVDEAGLLSIRTTAELFELADRLDARVILSGDRRQHGSVDRSGALRLLEEEAGLVPAEIREIQRQKDAYKSAVEALSEGHVESGFNQLDKLGWIREVADDERYKMMADDYVAALNENKTALVIAPTHIEGEWISDEIRTRLKQTGRLGNGERRLLSLESANLTEAERRDLVNFSAGDVIVFHQNAKGYRKGERIVVGTDPLPLSEAGKFQVYRPNILPVAPGEMIRITRNATTLDGDHRLNNGATFPVKEFDNKGNIVLGNGWKLPTDFGFLKHGYVTTSHSSQGRTVDRVFIGESERSFPAASVEQFYVSVSRAKEKATIYTSNKDALLEAVSRSADRLTATEFVASRDLRKLGAMLHRITQLTPERTPSRELQPQRGEGMSHER